MSLPAWIGMAVMGALGAHARFSATAFVTRRRPGAFPAGTFVVNVTGGFALGVLTGAGLTDGWLFVFGTGFLGGYTTFSTWMVETESLAEQRAPATLAAYLLGSLLVGALATGAGWALAGALS